MVLALLRAYGVRFKKTIATLTVASVAALLATQWLSCAQQRPLESLARLAHYFRKSEGSAMPALSESPPAEPPAMALTSLAGVALPVASGTPMQAPAPPSPPSLTIADVLDTSSCSTAVVKGLSAQIIAEEACLRPNGFQKLPDTLAARAVDEVVFPYLAPPAQAALIEAMADARRVPMAINSMLRTIAQQYLLYHWYKTGRCHIKLAAVPGRSNHQSGLALDVADPKRWRPILLHHGFRWMGPKDRWHFDFVGQDPEEKNEVKRISEAHAGLDVRAFQRLWNKNHPTESLGESGNFDERTERALRLAPSIGFASTTTCAK